MKNKMIKAVGYSFFKNSRMAYSTSDLIKPNRQFALKSPIYASPPPPNDPIDKTGTYLMRLIVLSFVGLGGYIAYNKLAMGRESPIIGNNIVKDKDNYHQLTEKEIESLENKNIRQKIISRAKQRFLLKGAKNKECFIRELVVAEALNSLFPSAQPQPDIAYKKIDNDPHHLQYFTLSEIKPNSQDLEAFILNNAENWPEMFSQKPVLGFGVSLAMIGMIAGQQDCKLANMIITEYDDHFEIGLIDFEMTGTAWLSKMQNQYRYTMNKDELIKFIREVRPDDMEYKPHEKKLALYHSKETFAFVTFLKDHYMDEADILDLYQRVSVHDFSPIIVALTHLKETGIVHDRDIAYWEREFAMWGKQAKLFLEKQEQKPKASEASTFKM